MINPVLLLDEVDKLGADYRGDPSAALLEVLDPEQNRAFNDHYLEVAMTFARALRYDGKYPHGDPRRAARSLEIIRLSGYLDLEKFAIARQFLVPKQLERHGVLAGSVTLESDVVPAIVRGYTREAGVRELERRIARIARKIARRRAERASDTPDVSTEAKPNAVDSIRADELKDLLGVAPYDPDDLSLDDKVGVASGLAYTSVGGEVLEVEVSIVPGRGRLQMTGTLGDVMKESATAALSYTRSRAGALGIPADFYKTRDVHVHIPAGATPKDGRQRAWPSPSHLPAHSPGTPIKATWP